jgi:hypothetical protein
MQMGMMKKHVRGPIRCCETIAKDILLIERAEALLHHPAFLGVTLNERYCGNEDNFGGEDEIRLLGSPVVHTSIVMLRAMLKEVLSTNPDVYEKGWEPDNYAREDLVIQEYRQARVGTCTRFTVDWNSGQKKTSDYYMYFSMPRDGRDISNRDIDEPELPPLEMLQSTESPPPICVNEMADYYYHHYVGQVRVCNRHLLNVQRYIQSH